MEIKITGPKAVIYVLMEGICGPRGLARPCLADSVGMLKSARLIEVNRRLVSAGFSIANEVHNHDHGDPALGSPARPNQRSWE